MKYWNAVYFLGVCFFAQSALCDYAVIVHPSNNAHLDNTQVERLFLSQIKAFTDGRKATPLNLHEDADARIAFQDKILKKTEEQLKAYWSRLIFTGKGVLVKQLNSAADVIEIVRKNPNAIGYVKSENVTADVKVILTY
ncbi:MAG: hypothetical protein MI864_25215 [Pseudomonadales bacterium]|nr:hypothetical protein [Pseudomonadales bacterium]